MWSFMAQPSVATAVLDFTNDLSWLGIGLVGLLALAAGSIALMAIHHHLSQSAKPAGEVMPADYREAA